MLCLDLFLAVCAPSGDPVLGDLVINQARALLPRGQALLLSEFLPFCLGLLLGKGLCSGGHDPWVGQVHTVEGLSIFKDLSVIALLGALLTLKIKELFEQCAEVLLGFLQYFLLTFARETVCVLED